MAESRENQYSGPRATAFGTYYPNGYVVAVLVERDGAERAAAGLRDAGFGAEEVRVWSGEKVIANHEDFEKHRNPLQRVQALFASDEREALDQYLENARAGHAFVTVHAPGADEMERARAVLAEYGAYSMHHYGPSVMTDLSSHPSGGRASG